MTITNFEDWKGIITAVETITKSDATKIEGKGWKVYRVGQIIRIDIALEGRK